MIIPFNNIRRLEEQIIDAQAKLARLKELPLSAFAEKSHKAIRYLPEFGPITYSVDNKDDAIARAKADIAELKTKLRLSERCGCGRLEHEGRL